MRLIIKTMEGLEPVLAQELEELQISNIQILRRAVECEANTSQLYKCNYLLRTAMRVLMPLGEYECQNENELYDAVQTIDWSQYLNRKTSFAIDSVVSGTVFTHSQYVTYKTKDAIVDQLKDQHGFRPNVDTKQSDIRINIHISQNKLTILLDSSGRSLHLRNYKYRTYKAPLNEVLAAGIIKLSGWDYTTDLQDPMCGSGTIITEALMAAAHIPAGKFIPHFAFQKWPDFHSEIWNSVKSAADQGIYSPEIEIIASDYSGYAVRDMKKNLQKFPFTEKVKVYQRDFFKTHGHQNRTLIFNPPYDKRVSIENVDEFYSKIGDALKTFWQGSTAWIISGNKDALKRIGLRPTQKFTLFNGGIESKLYKFELYEGSKKQTSEDHPGYNSDLN